MEYLDYYDSDGNLLGKETRDIVHEKGLWHKTIHCWLYDEEGNVYFQLRADNGKMYTTASGHVDAGESLSQAFAREVKEEIGIEVNITNAQMVQMVIWKMDKKKTDGTIINDRAFSNAFINKVQSDIANFCFDEAEVSGIIKVNAKEALEILRNERGSAKATKITASGTQQIEIGFDDFLVNSHEIGLIKYGLILQAIINA
jgi:8-oxo-dGTP pyrophosphatase MutT (NUDIX family)